MGDSNNNTAITCNDESFQNDASCSDDGCNSNQNKDKETNLLEVDYEGASPPPKKRCLRNMLNNDGDNIDAGNMAKINDSSGSIHIGETHHGHQATANATNGNAQTIGRDNRGIMANNLRIDNQTINYGSCPPLWVPDHILDFSIIFKDLSAILLEYSKKTFYKPDSSDDQTFSLHAGYVPLQISLFQQNDKTNTHGHSQSSQEIINSYKKPRLKNLEPGEFFKEAENFIRGSDFYQKIQSEEGKENYLYYKSKIIGVIGQAGVGKSTLIQNLSNQFAETGELYESKYNFLIHLRDFYDKPEISLFQFLIGENACRFNLWTKNENISTKVFKLLADEESVCILLDGLDEAEFNPEDKVDVNASNFLKQTPGNFLLALLCGQLLPKAKKIITSRPGQMLDLPSKYKPEFILTISGITQHGVKQICQNMCGDDEPQVYKHILNQPDLKSYTLVPINCVLIVHCIYKLLLSDEFESLPKNMTDVFVLSFLNFLRANYDLPWSSNKFNLKNLNHLKNISQLAWSGLRNRQFYFDGNDLKKAGLDHVDISYVTVTVKHQNHKKHLLFLQNATSNCTYFSQTLFQEFFSAIYCLFFMDSKTFENTFFSLKQFDLQSNEFLMVTKFLFGLSNSKTLKILHCFYPDISDATEHIKLLKDLARKIALTACTINDEADRFRSVLCVCSWLYELHDPKFSKQISDTLPTNIDLCGNILPSDVLSFCHVIKTRTKPLSLTTDNYLRVRFVGNAFRLLLDGLQFIETNSAVQVKKLDLFDININSELAEVLSKFVNDGMEDVRLSDCNVTPQGMKKISTQISNMTCPLQSLNIIYNDIGDSGWKSVAACVDKIESQLWIGSTDDNSLTLVGVKALIEKIKTSPFQMKELLILCPDEIESAVHQELLGLKNKVDEVELNQTISFRGCDVTKSYENEVKAGYRAAEKNIKNSDTNTISTDSSIPINDDHLKTDAVESDLGSNPHQGKETSHCSGDKIDAQIVVKVGIHNGPMYIGGPSNSDDKFNHSEIFKELPKVLVELGKEAFKHSKRSDDQTIGRNAGYVPLQIDIYLQNNDMSTSDNWHPRQKNIKSCSDNLEPAEFFQKAEKFIRESDYYQDTRTAVERENYLSRESKIVGVIGQAGVGKSTLIKNLYQQFVKTGELYKAKYVFKIDLRDFYDKSEISLFEFLMGENACGFNEWTKDKSICTEVLKLFTDWESVCILLDGLDESKFNSKDKVNVNASNFLKQKPGNFLLALLSGQLLPKAKKLITSRPGQMLDLPVEFKPKFILNILGITQKGVKKICQNMCGGHATGVYKQIEKQPDLQSYSSVPINCVLIVDCIYWFLSTKGKRKLPDNVTDVFVLSFLNSVGKKHMTKKSSEFNLKNFDHLKKICQLAWSGMQERKFVFNIDDLKAVGLNQVDISSVAVTVQVENNETFLAYLQNETPRCTYFSHLLIQEFFSAIYCLFLMDSKTFENTFFSSKKFDLQSNEFLMVTKFLFGLSNLETFKKLNIFYQQNSDPTEHIKLLKDLARTIASTACTIKDERDSFKSVLTACSWVYEFHDPNFSKEISDTLPRNIVLCGSIQPSDALSFCHVIKTRTEPLSLSTDNYLRVRFVGKALWQLLDGLQFIKTNSAVQINSFNIWGNIIGDSGFKLVAACVDQIKSQLWIGSKYDKDLTLNGVKELIEKIRSSSCRMKELRILCPDELESAVRQQLLGLQDKVDEVKLNHERLFDEDD